jgi:hypothetical protein
MKSGHRHPHHDEHGTALGRAGISPLMWGFLVVSILVAIWQGSNVVSSSGYWPHGAVTDQEKVALPPYHP